MTAYKFRDPEGHPLELISFPETNDSTKSHDTPQPFMCIDHSAISVADSKRSVVFYESLGLTPGAYSSESGHRTRTLGCGESPDRRSYGARPSKSETSTCRTVKIPGRLRNRWGASRARRHRSDTPGFCRRRALARWKRSATRISIDWRPQNLQSGEIKVSCCAILTDIFCSLTRTSLAQSLDDAVSHTQSICYDRQGGIDRSDRWKEAGVGDIEIVEFMRLAIDIEDRR